MKNFCFYVPIKVSVMSSVFCDYCDFCCEEWEFCDLFREDLAWVDDHTSFARLDVCKAWEDKQKGIAK